MSYINENGKRPISTIKSWSPKSPGQRPSWTDHGHSRIFPSSNQSDPRSNGSQGDFSKAQAKVNQIQEAEQMREWVSKEDDFMLQQTKKKARIRIKEGRAQTIDKLIVTLGAVDMTRDSLEEEEQEEAIEAQAVDPVSLIENLGIQEVKDLTNGIASLVFLEKHPGSRKLWKALQVMCDDRIRKATRTLREGRSVAAVSTELDKLLNPKSSAELSVLEKQVERKLGSDEPIDVEYWEQLLRDIVVYKARAELNQFGHSIMSNRAQTYLQQQKREAVSFRNLLTTSLSSIGDAASVEKAMSSSLTSVATNFDVFDPGAALKIRPGDGGFEIIDENKFFNENSSNRKNMQKEGSAASKTPNIESKTVTATKSVEGKAPTTARFATIPSEDFSQATKTLYDREVARGVQEDEEIFASEESLNAVQRPQWASKYRPRKPRYFNRVQMGYEWNKYNQTHYDHDNPPPKVVQGYKFNVFYPDLIDKTKAPTYRIERENGRKRGQSFAPAGEEDTCLIRFVSGPPYEDIAFRIVDKEWDFSAKRDRGFRSSFDKGILQLHFSFKKVYYRK